MSLLPEQMDPMDSVLVMVFVISVASGMVHPEEIDWPALWRPLSAFLKFWYTWLYRSAQALCQNAGRINPSFAAVQQKSGDDDGQEWNRDARRDGNHRGQ